MHNHINYWQIFKDSAKRFYNDDPMSYSASIAFYTMFSMPAIFVIAVSIAASVYQDQAVRDAIIHQIQILMGNSGAKTVQSILAHAHIVGTSLWAKVIGIITLLFSATTVFISLQNSLNNIWGIQIRPDQGILYFIINRLLSLAMVVSIGFLLLVSLIFDALIVIFNDALTQLLSNMTFIVVWLINAGFSFAVITLVFALIFKVLPDAHVQWRDVWTGALVTTILFTIGKYLIGIYLSFNPLSSAYGAAGSLVLLLIWVYYSSLIVLFGAEFTYVYSKATGRRIKVNKHAVAFTKKKKGSDTIT